MIVLFFIIVSVLQVTNAADTVDCYECEHHDHHHHQESATCRFFTCATGQYCRLNVDSHHGVTGKCEHGHGHDHDINHCYHDMHHWCHDYQLSTFHGKCVFCCTTSDCVRQALQLPNPTTTPASTTTSTPTTHSPCTTDHKCADIYPDCATTVGACGLQFGPIVCEKHCGLCDKSSVLPNAHSTTPYQSTTTSLPVCANQMNEDNCHLVPNVCSDRLASVICPEYCGYCQGASTTTATTTPTTPTTTTQIATLGACSDHSSVCATAGICLDSIGRQICQKTCNSCPGTTTLPPPSSSSTTVTTTATTITTQADATTTTTPTTITTQAATTTTTTPTTTTTTTTTKPSRSCYQCGDQSLNIPCTLAEVTLGTPATCPSGTYCMTDVYNTLDGRMEIMKRCVHQQECRRKWYDETSDRSICVNFDSLNRIADLSCHFCCTNDDCNTNIVPDTNRLYSP